MKENLYLFRQWGIEFDEDGPFLCPLHYGEGSHANTWISKHAKANHKPHRWNKCGLYAMRELPSAPDWVGGIWGMVSLYGQIIEYEDGEYRGEEADIEGIFWPRCGRCGKKAESWTLELGLCRHCIDKNHPAIASMGAVMFGLKDRYNVPIADWPGDYREISKATQVLLSQGHRNVHGVGGQGLIGGFLDTFPDYP
jgi:hypothetical protein